MIGNPLGRIRKDVIRVRQNTDFLNSDYRNTSLFQLGTEQILKYLRNRLTVDDGTDESKTYDIPRTTETDDEKKRRLYTEHHVVRSTGTFDIR